MNCDKVFGKLSAYMDNEVAVNEKQAIEQHVQGCAACAEELKILLKSQRYLKRLETVKPSDQLRDKLFQRISADNGKTGLAMGIGEILAGLWIPVPVIAAAVVIVFLGFTVLSPILYAKSDGMNSASELSKGAFSAMSGKNIISPLNYI